MKAKFEYKKGRKRLGRGPGSGLGKTSGKGHKGQLARSGSGARIRPGFEGGQNPLYRRLPKRGFNNAAFQTTYAIINLDRIAELDVSEVTPEFLKEQGIVKNALNGLKVLGSGDLKKAVKVHAHRFSRSAEQKIKKAGGEAVVIQ